MTVISSSCPTVPGDEKARARSHEPAHLVPVVAAWHAGIVRWGTVADVDPAVWHEVLGVT
jgi:hypothetical protein